MEKNIMLNKFLNFCDFFQKKNEIRRKKLNFRIKICTYTHTHETGRFQTHTFFEGEI